jgi:prepilin-type N-terminal cleavage/methylation domain-containing protein/prepilin-type processing-associated H-X9-DG protein
MYCSESLSACPLDLRSSHMPRTGRRAFTLVELLVVIGIIAVLLGILMPALNGARQKARTVQCLSNLRQIGMAAQMYAVAKGYVVPAAYHSDNRDAWPQILLYDKFITSETPLTLTSPPVNSGVFYCPEGNTDLLDEPAPTSFADGRANSGTRYKVSTVSPGLMVDVWYGINAASDPSTVSGAPGGKELPTRRLPYGSGSDRFAITKYARIKRSSEMVLFYDGVYMNYAQAPGRQFRIAPRHNRGTATNIAFLDGHAETLPRKALPQTVDEFKVATLNASYPTPVWRLDQ